MSAKSPVGKRLREARTRAGLTQYQLGVLAGLSEDIASTKINQYELDVHVPKFDRLQGLAKALKVPAAYFYAESNELAALLYAYEKSSGKTKQAISRMIKG